MLSMRPRVYLAGPISGNPEHPQPHEQQRQNCLVAIDWAQKLMDAGLAPFCPHLSFFWNEIHPNTWETWLELDEAWLYMADAVFRIPGASVGADREVAFAEEEGIPVYRPEDWELMLQALLPDPLPRIVGIVGYKRSGKNEVGRILAEKYGYNQAAYADVLKSMALAIDPLIPMQLAHPQTRPAEWYLRISEFVRSVGWEEAKRNPEVRRFLQYLGTEGVRNHLGSDAWVDALFRTFNPSARYVITDVRFLNEAQRIHSEGGLVIRVTRPGTTSDGHASEVEQDNIVAAYTIKNDGSLADLEKAVDNLMGAAFLGS